MPVDTSSFLVGAVVAMIVLYLYRYIKQRLPDDDMSSSSVDQSVAAAVSSGSENNLDYLPNENDTLNEGFAGGRRVDYNQILANTFVGDDVRQGHAEYTSDMNRTTSGASSYAERDDPNDVVPWTVRRPISYDYVYATDDAMKQIQSEEPGQMKSRRSRYYL